MARIIPFPAQKLTLDISGFAPASCHEKVLPTGDELLAAALEARDRMAEVAELLERVRQRLAEH